MPQSLARRFLACIQMESSLHPGSRKNRRLRTAPPGHHKDFDMTTILIIILILLLVGGLPVFPHSRSWGYGPSGIIGVILVVLLVLLLLGRI